MKILKWLFLIAGGLFGLMFLIASCTPNDGRRGDRDAIALCWKNQGKKSNAPNESRWIAGVCERMEDDFRKKYGVRP